MQVRKINIIGTNTEIYSAWEEAGKSKLYTIGHNFHTITTINEKWYGKTGTEELPETINSLPFGDERNAKINEYRKSQYEKAYQAILAAFPELHNTNYKMDMGEIITF